MGLKADIEAVFTNQYELALDSKGEEGTIKEVAVGLAAAYEDACKAGSDSLGNAWQGQLFPLVETAIEASLELCFNTKAPAMIFTPIEASLVACWAPALLKLPATHPGMSLVNLGNVIGSVPVPTPPYPPASDSSTMEPIVLAFYNMFTLHAKTLNFLYTGIAIAGVPPPPLVLPVPLFTIT